jgi:hypothetical protein
MESKILGIIKRNSDGIENLSGYEKSVLDKILNCRTETVPNLFTRCDRCSSVHPVYKSCKDRMCPVCNGSASIKWTAKRESELLPAGYFLLTYTVPSQLRSAYLANKKICYNLLFKSASLSLMEGVLNNNRKFHGRAGFFCMLHTWDQRMGYHLTCMDALMSRCHGWQGATSPPYSHPCGLPEHRRNRVDIIQSFIFSSCRKDVCRFPGKTSALSA